MKHFSTALLSTILLLSFLTVNAQYHFERNLTIPVEEAGNGFLNPWTGGINFGQFSRIDLDQDGTKDLFIFDRVTGAAGKIITYINNGTANAVDFTYAPQYESKFPDIHDWALLADYNCDGKEDIFTYSSGGMAVYKNTSTIQDGLQFELITPLLYSYQPPNDLNLFVSSVDIPAIVDIDNDGDLDVLTFGIWGNRVEYHRNYSMENYGTCDSLDFELRNKCWGLFIESSVSNSVALYDTCTNDLINNPELPVLMEEAIAKLEQERRSDRGPHNFSNRQKHVGSALLALDMDGNGVKELVLSDVSFNNMTLLTNSGTVVNTNTAMNAQDVNFPSNTIPVDMSIFPGGYYLDVDNDNVRDLIVSPNSVSISENYNSVWYYKNNGTDDVPLFTYQKENMLQDEMIELGEGAMPVLFDHNADGLLDVVVSNYGYFNSGSYDGQVALFENVGSANNPEFELVTRDYQNLSQVGMGESLYLTFGDLDGDNDEDMFVGDLGGKIHYFENTAGAGNTASFILSQSNYQDNGGTTIDVGQFATPFMADIDRDLDLDLLVGERNGNINYFENIGDATTPAFKLKEDSLGEHSTAEWWDIVGYSIPVVFEDSGSYRLLVGSKSGYVHYFDDVENYLGINDVFPYMDTTFANINVGPRSAPAIADLNNDGYLDMIVGNYRGGLSYYSGSFDNSVANITSAEIEFNVFPNPASSSIQIQFNNSLVNDYTIMVTNVIGETMMQLQRNGANTTLDISKLSSGIYFCTVQAGNASKTNKFMVIR